MRILFIKLRHIGDSLLLTPTLVATKEKIPHAEIWVLVRESCDGILAGCPEIDRILTTANPDVAKRRAGGWLADLRLAILLRRTPFDYVFELTDNDRARVFAIAASTHARCTNMHRTLRWFWRPFFDTICRTKRYPKHQVIRDYTCPSEVLALPETPGPLRFARSRMQPWKAGSRSLEEPFAVLHIHTRWPQKSWPMDRWEALISRLFEFLPRLVLSCGPGAEEVTSAQALCTKFGPRLETTGGSANWAQLAWILQRARFFVGVDTAAMHLAAACGCPTVALFGPSPVFEYHPWRVPHWLIQPDSPGMPEALAEPKPPRKMDAIPLDKVLQACQDANRPQGALVTD
jgi:heptosyltransferase-3